MPANSCHNCSTCSVFHPFLPWLFLYFLVGPFYIVVCLIPLFPDYSYKAWFRSIAFPALPNCLREIKRFLHSCRPSCLCIKTSNYSTHWTLEQHICIHIEVDTYAYTHTRTYAHTHKHARRYLLCSTKGRSTLNLPTSLSGLMPHFKVHSTLCWHVGMMACCCVGMLARWHVGMLAC